MFICPNGFFHFHKISAELFSKHVIPRTRVFGPQTAFGVTFNIVLSPDNAKEEEEEGVKSVFSHVRRRKLSKHKGE